jgi:multiple sugar transport system permease protein
MTTGVVKAGFRSPRGALLFYLAMIIFVVLTLFPIYWVFKMSIVTETEMRAVPPKWLPSDITLDAYDRVFADNRFQRGIVNSIIVAGFTTVLCLGVGALAAYALARIKFFLRAPVLTLVLAIAFFPQVAILAPLFLQFNSAGLYDTYWAMIIPNTLFASPLAVYLLVAYFRELPLELEEAARVDGASPWQAFRKVTLPLAIPGVVTTGILTFIFAWNEFLFANTFTLSPVTQPATVVIPNFASQYTTDYAAQAAAALVVTVPLALLVLIFQRKIVSGLTAGASR